MDALRYPIGRFRLEGPITADGRRAWIEDVAKAPMALRAAVHGLSSTRLSTPYRPDGWTVRQVVHHVLDSHVNANVRFKLALTEKEPVIRPYDEHGWASLRDTDSVPLDVPLRLLEAVHARWVGLLRSLTVEEYRRTFRHPEHGRAIPLDEALAMYAWHGRHHVAHITALRKREDW